MSKELFPLGLATGRAFCNREVERARFNDNFEKIHHTLLISPRRYGKTSLALKVIEESDLSFVVVDFFVVPETQTVERYILEGIAGLINKVVSKPELALQAAKEVLKNVHVKLDLSKIGISLEFSSPSKNTPKTILESLKGLEKLLAMHKQKAIFLMDEFQQIGQVKHSSSIEGAIRHVAQQSKHLIFIFSGSNRHLLSSMFDDRARPLYMLCDRINLKRISKESYTPYLNKAAKEKWNAELNEKVINAIIRITERHPYYLNVLCSRLWSRQIPPMVENIQKEWEDYTKEEKSRIGYDLNRFSVNQKKILIAIAKDNSEALTSQSFLSEYGLSGAGALQALRKLEAEDYVFKTEDNKYYLVDPLIKTALNLFEGF